MIDINNTILTPDEYEQVKLVNLGRELRGSSDHPEKDAQAMIYRVERGLINYLTFNYDFKKADLDTSTKKNDSFKLAICDQIEWFISQGITTPTAVDEYQRQHPKFLCEAAEYELLTHGMLNMRTY